MAVRRTPRAAGKCPTSRRLFLRGCIVIAAGFLVHLSLGTLYTIGNLIPYVVSYIRARSHPTDLTSETATWIGALNLAGQGSSMFVGGWLEKRIGPRWSTLIGGWLMSIGVLLSYFTIKVSFWLLLLTYGLVFGLGVGIAYVGPLSCAMRWMPQWKGVAGGFVVAGFGLGALIFDQVQSYYINPDNLKATEEDYFTNRELLDRVPFIFLILGGTYAVMQFVGSLFIVNPPHSMETPHSNCKEQAVNDRHSDREEKRDENSHINAGSLTPPKEEFLSDSSSSSEDEVEGTSTVTLLSKQKADIDKNSDTVKSAVYTPKTSSIGAHPLRVLRSFNFYHLWVMMLLGGFSVSFISSLFKVFGLSFIDDDQFLAIVGSTSAILNCAGRIVWGLVADRVSYKFALVLQSGIMTIFLLTFYATRFVEKTMFFVWVCVIFFCVGGIFSLFPTAMALSFGPKFMSINYGLLFTSQISSGVIAAVLFTTLQNLLDWDGIIFLVSGVSLVGFFVTLCFHSIKYY